MSDWANHDRESKNYELDEHDPLAELARIVAGDTDYELEKSAPQPEVALPDKEPVREELESADPTQTSEIARESGHDGTETPVMPQPQPDFEASLSEVLEAEQVDSRRQKLKPEQPYAAQVTNKATQPDSENSGSEGSYSFEDGLISALQTEINPTSQPVNHEFVSQIAESEELYPDKIRSDVEHDDASTDAEPASGEESRKGLEDDLGAAFDQEFKHLLDNDDARQKAEQVLSISPETHEDPTVADQDDEIDAPMHAANDVCANPLQDVLSLPAHDLVQRQAEQKQTGLAESGDMDFGSAFVEELGLKSLETTDGWAKADTENSEAEFASVATGDKPSVEPVFASTASTIRDPGHVGTVPGYEHEWGNKLTQPAEPRSGSLKYALAALILALFAGTIAAGYGFLGESDDTAEPQIIKADAEPVKVKPEDPGGRVVANQDNASYDGVSGENVDSNVQERLVSNTEEPATIVVEDRFVSGSDEPTPPEKSVPPKISERLATGGEPETAANSANGDVTPRVVKTVIVKPDGTIVESAAAPRSPGDARQTTDPAVKPDSGRISLADAPIPEVAIPPTKPVATEKIAVVEPIDGAKTENQIAVPLASPLPKPEPALELVVVAPEPVEQAAVVAPQPAPAPKPAATSTPTSVSRSEWVVQISSQTSPETAQASYRSLLDRYDVLQGRPMSVQRATVNGATYFRVRVLTASRSDANELCDSMKASGGSCFVTR